MGEEGYAECMLLRILVSEIDIGEGGKGEHTLTAPMNPNMLKMLAKWRYQLKLLARW